MRVGEKGIDALSKDWDRLPNIQLPDASLRAWRLTQVCCNSVHTHGTGNCWAHIADFRNGCTTSRFGDCC